MLARRIIPCLDVRHGRVVKGVQFKNHEDVGDIIDLAMRYRDQGADELVFYDITASVISGIIDIPFCVAGGIKSIDAARARLAAGADKISINSPALERPELINELSEAFGKQCIVIGIDTFEENGQYRVKSHTGDPDKTKETGRSTIEWVQEIFEHFKDVFQSANVDGALAASVFHKSVIAIPDLKHSLKKSGIEIRL